MEQRRTPAAGETRSLALSFRTQHTTHDSSTDCMHLLGCAFRRWNDDPNRIEIDGPTYNLQSISFHLYREARRAPSIDPTQFNAAAIQSSSSDSEGIIIHVNNPRHTRTTMAVRAPQRPSRHNHPTNPNRHPSQHSTSTPNSPRRGAGGHHHHRRHHHPAAARPPCRWIHPPPPLTAAATRACARTCSGSGTGSGTRRSTSSSTPSRRRRRRRWHRPHPPKEEEAIGPCCSGSGTGRHRASRSPPRRRCWWRTSSR